MTRLATRSTSWIRFQDMVELSLLVNNTTSKSMMKSAVDIGTDHGLLAICLAASERFSDDGGVLGVDVSEQALESGAFRMLGKLQTYWKTSGKEPLPVDFRVGNGLADLQTGQEFIRFWKS